MKNLLLAAAIATAPLAMAAEVVNPQELTAKQEAWLDEHRKGHRAFGRDWEDYGVLGSIFWIRVSDQYYSTAVKNLGTQADRMEFLAEIQAEEVANHQAVVDYVNTNIALEEDKAELEVIEKVVKVVETVEVLKDLGVYTDEQYEALLEKYNTVDTTHSVSFNGTDLKIDVSGDIDIEITVSKNGYIYINGETGPDVLEDPIQHFKMKAEYDYNTGYSKGGVDAHKQYEDAVDKLGYTEILFQSPAHVEALVNEVIKQEAAKLAKKISDAEASLESKLAKLNIPDADIPNVTMNTFVHSSGSGSNMKLSSFSINGVVYNFGGNPANSTKWTIHLGGVAYISKLTQGKIDQIIAAAEAAYENGYGKGYDKGYADGYKAGYSDGFTDGVNSVK